VLASGDDGLWGLARGNAAKRTAPGQAAAPAAVGRECSHRPAWEKAGQDRVRRRRANPRRYHNKSYRDAAQSLGLKATWTQGGTGWSATTAGAELLTVYEGPVRQLVIAMTEWQPPAPLPRSVRKSGGNGISARCQCQPPRTIRMRGIDAATDLRDHPVVCTVCGKPFTP
jgi:hypothetical protein